MKSMIMIIFYSLDFALLDKRWLSTVTSKQFTVEVQHESELY